MRGIFLLFNLILISSIVGCGQQSRQSQSQPSETVSKPESSAVKTQVPQTTSTAPAPTPTPSEPPGTSQGRLVQVERSNKTETVTTYLTTSGLRSERTLLKAGKNNIFLILHFEGKAKQIPEKNGVTTLTASGGGRLEQTQTKSKSLWLSDNTGKKYSKGIGFSKKKGTSQIAYEVPADATGLIWHDGEKAYQLEPTIVLLEESKDNASSSLPKKESN